MSALKGAKANQLQQPTAEMVALLKQTGSKNRQEATAAMRALAVALETPLRQGVLSGDIIGNIFAVENLDPGATAEYPLDFYQPGMEGQYVAYTLPSEGALPQRNISGDSVTVTTYDVGNAIDWPLKYQPPGSLEHRRASDGGSGGGLHEEAQYGCLASAHRCRVRPWLHGHRQRRERRPVHQASGQHPQDHDAAQARWQHRDRQSRSELRTSF